MRLRIITRCRALAVAQEGFSMIFALLVLFISSLLVVGAFAAAKGDVRLTATNTNQLKAYYAAVAGIDIYKAKLTSDPNYWLKCKTIAGKVPGTTDESYTVRTLWSEGHSKKECEEEKQAAIVETSKSASGTFRIESVGSTPKGGTSPAGESRKIVATFTHPGFLNYVFLSNFEVEDPTTIEPEPKNCAHYYPERVEKGWTAECPPITFIPSDKLNGPFHTNDAVEVCELFGEKPTFGRVSTDAVEMNHGHYKDTFCGGGLTILGKYTESAPTLLPPETDNELLESAEAGYKLKGRTVIELSNGSPNKMTVTNSKGKETKSFPTNGVVFIENEGACPKYSPFKYDKYYEEDEKTPTCGNVYVKGSYTESLTIASQNDVIIIGNVETTHEASGKPTGAATLGLIAQNFVRVYHPVKSTGSGKNTRETCEGSNQTAAEDPRKWGSLKEPVVDAAILSTKHSWIVDNFACGQGEGTLGNLTVWGAIAQYWRGRVTGNLEGEPYIKSYNYDERLASQQPPNFLSPTSTTWHISRETAPQTGFEG